MADDYPRHGPVDGTKLGKGKGEDVLNGLWRRLKQSQAKIQAVATDTASGYMAAVWERLSKANQVFDHFHLVK